MAKKNKGKEKRNSVSETKINGQKILREKIISIVNEKSIINIIIINRNSFFLFD